MTRDQAAQIILAAVGDETPLDAAGLAAALDALGLLTYATDPHLHPASATSNTQERSSHEYWASQRIR